MLMEDEITVKVTSDYETLHNELVKNGFKLLEEYEILDLIPLSLTLITLIHKSAILSISANSCLNG